MHDPFQTYANMGVPYNVQQTSGINPLAGVNPLATINPFAAAALGLSPGIPANINPITGIPQTGQQGYGYNPAQGFGSGFGFISPQQLQVAAALASQAAIPQLFGHSPVAGGIQNPLVAALLTNPLVAAGLHSQLGQQPQQLYSQLGQMGGSPYGPGTPIGLGTPTAGIGYPLAPQSWVGQGRQFGGGQGYGEIHQLVAQLTARALQGQGFSPWGY